MAGGSESALSDNYIAQSAREASENYGGGVGDLTPRLDPTVGRGGMYAETPVSQMSGLGSILTDPGDDSRAATKRELDRLRVTVRAMYAELRQTLAEEVRQREMLGDTIAERISTLAAQFDEGPAVASETHIVSRLLDSRIEVMSEALHASLEQVRSDLRTITDPLSDKVQELEATVMSVEESAQ